MYLPFHSMRVDLKRLTSKVDGFKNDKFHLSIHRIKARSLNQLQENQQFFLKGCEMLEESLEWGNFAKTWALQFKGNKNALPTLQELLDGLLYILCDKIDSKIAGTEIFERD